VPNKTKKVKRTPRKLVNTPKMFGDFPIHDPYFYN
jgi:hypothetical protein